MTDEMSRKLEAEVIDAYLSYFESYASRCWEQMVGTFSDSMTMIGTGIDENGLDYGKTIGLFKREFQQASGKVTYKLKSIDAHLLSDTSAYVVVLMDMWIDCKSAVYDGTNNRTTAILRKENGSWKLVHGHWSQPKEGQDEGESVPLRLLREQNIALTKEVEERTRQIEEQNQKLTCLVNTKNRLFSIVAHDLKSPFNAFVGLTDMMLANFDANWGNEEYFRTRLGLLNENARTLYNTTENLLNWARSQCDEVAVSKSHFNIHDLLDEQVNILAHFASKKKIRVKNSTDKTLMCYSDREILGIVVKNFLTNAVKYSKPEQHVVINARITKADIRITITDKGVGMTEEQLGRLFNDYYSTPGTGNEKGTGLGLIICKELIGKLGGRLSVKSAAGKGCRVSVILPEN